ncbi:MAG: hypothetical protein ACON4O_00110 [Lentimonas sp.]
MPDSQNTNSNFSNLLSVLGGLGAIVIFALIIFVAYIPNRPAPVDAEIIAARQAKVDEIRGQGVAKLGEIQSAMEATVSEYRK